MAAVLREERHPQAQHHVTDEIPNGMWLHLVHRPWGASAGFGFRRELQSGSESLGSFTYTTERTLVSVI